MATYAGGSGTSADPYQVATWEHLWNVRDNLTDEFVLVNDLNERTNGYDTYAADDANLGDGFRPIGNFNDPLIFEGVFDGNGHEIADINIDGTRLSKNTGIFAAVSGEIKNLSVSNASIVSDTSAGVLCAGLGQGGTVENCFVSGTIQSSGTAGGLFGVTAPSSFTFKNCWANVDIEGYDGNNPTTVGGFGGELSYGDVVNCYAVGEVTSSAANSGGLIGNRKSSTNPTITDCYFDTQTTTQSVGVGDGSDSGTTGLTTSEMTGNDASTNMGAFDFSSVYAVSIDSSVDIKQDAYPYIEQASRAAQLRSQDGVFGVDVTDWYDFDELRNAQSAPFTLQNDLTPTTAGYSDVAGGGANAGNGFESVQQFDGRLDGGGHVIEGLTADRTDINGALFNELSGVVENVVFADADITISSANPRSASLIGFGRDGAYIDSIAVSGSFVGVNASPAVSICAGSQTGDRLVIENVYTTASVEAEQFVSGIVGQISDVSEMRTSYMAGTVTSTNSTESAVAFTNNGEVNDVYWNDTVTSPSNGAVETQNGTADITALSTVDMSGSSAETTMGGLDFTSVFTTTDRDLDSNVVSNSFPIIQYLDRTAQLRVVGAYGESIQDWFDFDDIRNDVDGAYILEQSLDENTSGYGSVASSSANSSKGFEPIGGQTAFSGELYGRGNELSDVFISRSDGTNAALFESVSDASISNLAITDATVEHTSTANASVLAASVGGSSDITGLFVEGSVTSSSGDAASVAATVEDTANIELTYSFVDVTAGGRAGGLVVEQLNSADIIGSYVAAGISGTVSEAGVVVDRSGNDIVDVYYDSTKAGVSNGILSDNGSQNSTTDVTPLSTSDMQGETPTVTMSDFDFTNVWSTTSINDDVAVTDSYPYLRSLSTEAQLSPLDVYQSPISSSVTDKRQLGRRQIIYEQDLDVDTFDGSRLEISNETLNVDVDGLAGENITVNNETLNAQTDVIERRRMNQQILNDAKQNAKSGIARPTYVNGSYSTFANPSIFESFGDATIVGTGERSYLQITQNEEKEFLFDVNGQIDADIDAHAFSYSENYVATVDVNDETNVVVQNTSDGSEKTTLSSAGSRVTTVTFSNENDTDAIIAYGTSAGNIYVHDVEPQSSSNTWSQTQNINSYNDTITSLAVSPDNTYLAAVYTSSGSSELEVYDRTNTYNVVYSTSTGSGWGAPITDVAFNESTDYFAFVKATEPGNAAEIVVRDVNSSFGSVSTSPITASNNYPDFDTGEMDITDIEFGGNPEQLVYSTDRGDIVTHNVSEFTSNDSFDSDTSLFAEIRNIEINTDNTYIFATPSQFELVGVKKLSLDTLQTISVFTDEHSPHDTEINRAYNFSENGTYVLYNDTNNNADVYDNSIFYDEQTYSATLPAGMDINGASSFTTEKGYFAYVNNETEVIIENIGNWTTETTVSTGASDVYDIQFSNDGEYLLIGNGVLDVDELINSSYSSAFVANIRQRSTVNRHISSSEFSPDGQYVVAGVPEDDVVPIINTSDWSVETYTENAALDATFSPNSEYIATVHGDRGTSITVQRVLDPRDSVGVWPVVAQMNMERGNNVLFSADFSNDGRYLAVRGDGVAKIFSTSDWSVVETLTDISSSGGSGGDIAQSGDIAFTKDSAYLLVEDSNEDIVAYNTFTFDKEEVVKEDTSSGEGQNLISLSDNAEYIAISDADANEIVVKTTIESPTTAGNATQISSELDTTPDSVVVSEVADRTNGDITYELTDGDGNSVIVDNNDIDTEIDTSHFTSNVVRVGVQMNSDNGYVSPRLYEWAANFDDAP